MAELTLALKNRNIATLDLSFKNKEKGISISVSVEKDSEYYEALNGLNEGDNCTITCEGPRPIVENTENQ